MDLNKVMIVDSKNLDKFLDSAKTKELVFADLHIHSKYSRACSTNLSFPNLVKWARIKGINLLGTGDFTHPLWLEEIKKLKEEKGLFFYDRFPFILSGEVSLMYTKGKGRRIHLVLLAPSIEVVEKINIYLDTKGRRDYDGRPIFNISVEEFAREMMKIDEKIEIIPGHCLTPWFGIFGSKTGFDNLKEAFGEQEKNIHAIETGMSADPEMLQHFSFLNNKSIVSFSDSHSFWPFRLGREATIFNKVESYDDLIKQIRENSFAGTIETSPEYGKYHWDGHRLCNFSCSPKESKKLNAICPVCKKPLTIGVENRVNELGNQEPEKNTSRKPYYKILPLHELIAVNYNIGMAGKKAWEIYNKLIEKFGNEFNILLKAEKEELSKMVDNKLVELIIENREARLKVKPGYDGEYGKIIIDGKKLGVDSEESETKKEIKKPAQQTLF